MEVIIDIIKQQANIDDSELIVKKYNENDNDISNTILDLLKIKPIKTPEKRDKFSEMRKILDDKDNVYHKKESEKNFCVKIPKN